MYDPCLGQQDVGVVEFSGEADHVHALLELHSSVMPAKLINSIKTVTSRRIRKDDGDAIKSKRWRDRFWPGPYCLLSVGDDTTTDIIRRYIENQAKPS
ncbi:IS200/IS605 family transposase [Halomonas vilamensis]|uniref:IS200/IS605 family transposase n=1 Tax=Vreelandella vilamensis TaxID=531309 RepID=A0ABU1H7E5_9GAMM|nr:IS200/IS605 family transposase [Halomonas vilamensis]MDR5900040.1 IS200/IS605 family transposase [Halomonas vilamensis]